MSKVSAEFYVQNFMPNFNFCFIWLHACLWITGGGNCIKISTAISKFMFSSYLKVSMFPLPDKTYLYVLLPNRHQITKVTSFLIQAHFYPFIWLLHLLIPSAGCVRGNPTWFGSVSNFIQSKLKILKATCRRISSTLQPIICEATTFLKSRFS